MTENALRPIATPPGGGEENRAFGLPRRFLMTTEQTGGAFCTFEEDVPPGKGPPLHIHKAEHEFFYVLEGEIRFRCEDVTVEMAAGGSVVIPPGARHAFRNIGAETARIVVTLTPGGGDEFFRAVERQGLGPGDKAAIDALAAEHNLEFVGPPID